MKIKTKNSDTIDQALWWIAGGNTGLSSITMWQCFMGQENFPINHPYDPDDFSRCYDLLKCVPEFKDNLDKLKPLSKQWSNLVENWDKLTEMYEKNVANNWVEKKEIGMYDFMKTLIG